MNPSTSIPSLHPSSKVAVQDSDKRMYPSATAIIHQRIVRICL
jgi:hypothetical protein